MKGTIDMFTLNLLQLTDFQLEHVFFTKKPHMRCEIIDNQNNIDYIV